MTNLKVGDVVEGKVTGIEDYGIFVSVDDFYGLIHISEISNGFVKDVSNYAKVGDAIKVAILDIDKEKKQLKLSIKVFEKTIDKPRREKIQETEHGFSTLNTKLNTWIKQKITEINNNN